MNFEELKAALFARGNFGMKLGLERMEESLRRLGDPHRSVPALHVAGTLATVALVPFVLQAAQGFGALGDQRALVQRTLAVRYGLDTLAGVIDSDYRGEILCALVNHGDAAVEIEPGARIAQLVVERIALPEAVWAEDLDETERGAGGFGSTG